MAEDPQSGHTSASRRAQLTRAAKTGAKALGWAWTALATVVTVAVGVRDLLGADTDGWAKVLAIASGATMVALAAGLVWQVALGNDRAAISTDRRVEAARQGFERSGRLASSTPLLHQALHELRDYAHSARRTDPEDLRHQLRQSLEAQAEMWTAITGAPCRVCLKEAVLTNDAPDAVELGNADPRNVVVRTYLRHSTVDRTTPHDEPTPLQRNTDFLSLFEEHKTKHWFCSNNLDEEKNYGNPHRELSIDYNSTAIWPIQKRVGDKIDIWGFLCVDSLERGVFDTDADFGLGAAIADTLYTSLLVPTLVREPSPASKHENAIHGGGSPLAASAEPQRPGDPE